MGQTRTAQPHRFGQKLDLRISSKKISVAYNEAQEERVMRPNIKAMFLELNDKHFNGEIPDIPVVWNTRMTTTAGYCRYKRSGPAETFSRGGQALEPTKIDLSDKLFRHLDYDLAKIERTLVHEI